MKYNQITEVVIFANMTRVAAKPAGSKVVDMTEEEVSAEREQYQEYNRVQMASLNATGGTGTVKLKRLEEVYEQGQY